VNENAVKIPDRMWVAANALAASWTTPSHTPEDWLNNLGRALVLLQAARGHAAEGHPYWYGTEHIMTLWPDDEFGFAMEAPDEDD
jgi:hypothetical protein